MALPSLYHTRQAPQWAAISGHCCWTRSTNSRLRVAPDGNLCTAPEPGQLLNRIAESWPGFYFPERGGLVHDGVVAVVDAGDGAALEDHVVLGEGARLITENVLDLQCTQVSRMNSRRSLQEDESELRIWKAGNHHHILPKIWHWTFYNCKVCNAFFDV